MRSGCRRRLARPPACLPASRRIGHTATQACLRLRLMWLLLLLLLLLLLWLLPCLLRLLLGLLLDCIQLGNLLLTLVHLQRQAGRRKLGLDATSFGPAPTITPAQPMNANSKR
jgi:hypothetical protein